MSEIGNNPEPSPGAKTLTRGLAWLFVLLAGLGVVGGCLPLAWLRPLGEFLRRADDITPQRYARYLHVCWTFALGCLLLGLAARRGRHHVARFLDALAREIRTCLSRRPTFELSRSELGLLALVIGFGVAVRLAFLDRPMAYDEAYSFVNFARRPLYLAVSDYNSTNNHLFNTLLMHWAYRLWGQQEWALRLGPLGFGVLLVVGVYPWGRIRLGREPALLVTALVAGSPLLISYSVDARGYIYVAVCAVLLDWCLEGIHQGRPGSSLRWCGAWMTTVVGFWAMPIMAYPLAGMAGWYLLAPLLESSANRRNACRTRMRQLLVLLGLGGLATMGLYAPAYIFRGFLAIRHPFVLPIGLGKTLRNTPAAWWDAVGWWTEGGFPISVWLPAWAVGTLALLLRRDVLVRLALPFLATAFLMIVQQVTPPPRVFLFLAPWFYLLTAHGTDVVRKWLVRSSWGSRLAAVGILIATGVYAVRHPILFHASEHRWYVNVEQVVLSIREETIGGAGEPARLIAPLPCDLPAIYYLLRHEMDLPVNGVPKSGETVWLISRAGASPENTLRAGNVNLQHLSDELSPWTKRDEYPHLTLWVSRRNGQAATANHRRGRE